MTDANPFAGLECAACGGPVSSSLGNPHVPLTLASNTHPEDVRGSKMCRGCYDGPLHGYPLIRARRRSAQPAVASGPLSAEGREILVGDRVESLYDGDIGTVVRIEGKGSQIYCAWEKQPGPELWIGPKRCRHLAPIAAPPGGEKAMAWCKHCGCGSAVTAHLPTCPTLKTPGGSSTENSQRTGQVPAAQREASGGPPGPSLDAFTAAVDRWLKPLLPESSSFVFDMVEGRAPHCWVYNNGELVHEFGGWPFEVEHGDSVAAHIARVMMARASRMAPRKQPREASWLDGYAGPQALRADPEKWR